MSPARPVDRPPGAAGCCCLAAPQTLPAGGRPRTDKACGGGSPRHHTLPSRLTEAWAAGQAPKVSESTHRWPSLLAPVSVGQEAMSRRTRAEACTGSAWRGAQVCKSCGHFHTVRGCAPLCFGGFFLKVRLLKLRTVNRGRPRTEAATGEPGRGCFVNSCF